jgi:hypothetical protein
MRAARTLLALLALQSIPTAACSGSISSAGNTSSAGSTSSSGGSASATCASGSPLTGASYDVTKSRFAFGSTPVSQNAGGSVHWVGSDGVVAIATDGSEMGIMNANAPENGLPGWSGSDADLLVHVTAYYGAMGVASCQISGPSNTYGAGGSSSGGGTTTTTNAGLQRGIDGVPVSESLAVARFDVDDQTTYEVFYWPVIRADVVTAALALSAQLADPGALAAYKAKLPADAQGTGHVVIHHSHAGSTSPFQAAATYDVIQTTPLDDGGDLYFDANGNPITTTW